MSSGCARTLPSELATAHHMQRAKWGLQHLSASSRLATARPCGTIHAPRWPLPTLARAHAQLLGLLLYGTPALLLRATAAFGGGSADAAAAAAALPGPHPALRVLAALDAGATFSVLAEVRVYPGQTTLLHRHAP